MLCTATLRRGAGTRVRPGRRQGASFSEGPHPLLTPACGTLRVRASSASVPWAWLASPGPGPAVLFCTHSHCVWHRADFPECTQECRRSWRRSWVTGSLGSTGGSQGSEPGLQAPDTWGEAASGGSPFTLTLEGSGWAVSRDCGRKAKITRGQLRTTCSLSGLGGMEKVLQGGSGNPDCVPDSQGPVRQQP